MSKKVAIIASSINPIKQAHLLDWYKAIYKIDNDIQLFIGSKNKDIPYAKNFKIFSKKDKLKYLLKGKIFNKIQPLIDFNPQIIHLLTSNSFQSIEGFLNKRIKLIVSFRGFDINILPHVSENNLLNILQIFDKADVLHFISEDLKEKAIKLGANPKKCIVIHRSLQLVEYDDNFISKEELIISSVGRLVWEKGYPFALETMFILKQRNYNFKYYIAGNGLDENLLRFHIKRLNLDKNVIMTGELSRNEVLELLKKTDIYFQPSISEALSNSLIEASYYGLPIVSSNIGGIPEVVENNNSGFLTPICKPEEYAESIIKLIKSECLRREMGENGHKIVKEKFDRRKEIAKWIHLYEEIIS